ncbi:hypothetical protein ACQ4PT_053513 [Festuca glaucescens]
MKTSRAAILMMMLSLTAAALLAADATVVADVDMDIIRLPSDGDQAGLVAGQVMAVAATDAVDEKKGGQEEATAARENAGGFLNEEERPWPCCNETLCTKSYPPTCHCLDVVDRCAGACQLCEPSAMNPFRHVCNDEYHGLPGPTCSKDDEDYPSAAHGRSYPSLAAAAQLVLAFVVVLFIQSHY